MPRTFINHKRNYQRTLENHSMSTLNMGNSKTEKEQSFSEIKDTRDNLFLVPNPLREDKSGKKITEKALMLLLSSFISDMSFCTYVHFFR